MSLSQRFSLSSVFRSALSFTFAALLTGCTLATTAPDAPISGPALHGVTYGAGQPVIGQRVYLMAATVSGVGSAGYGVASTSLLSGTGQSDSIGSYVLSDNLGDWAFSTGGGSPTYLYTCPSANTQVYVYGVGGNPGAGTNGSESMMAALGSCGSLSSSTFVWMNELTTVAAAYSLSGFATDALHVSIPKYVNSTQQTNSVTDALAQTDLQNAFANAINLVNTATGVAQTTTPGGNGTPVTKQVITLGNILAACVNASDASPTNCTTLFSNALSGGSTGSTPTDTATAAINIAHNPYVSGTVMTNLYGLQPATGAPFAGGQTAKPTDFIVAISFTGGGLSGTSAIAIDGSGSAWVANTNNNSISKFSSSGVAVSSASGYTGGGLSAPTGIAIDGSGNAWTANDGNTSVSEFSSIGTAISTSTGYTGGGLNTPYNIAIDGLGNAWVTNNRGNSVSMFSSAGTPATSSFNGGGLTRPIGLAIDVSGSIWMPSSNGTDLSKFNSSGVALSGTGYTGGGISNPWAIAIDSSGNAWILNQGNNSLSKFNSSGTALSGSGYTGGGLRNFFGGAPSGIAIDGSGNAWATSNNVSSISKFSSTGTALSSSSGYTSGILSTQSGIAIDGSGNVWISNSSNSITELVGAATPIVTPLPASLIAPYSAAASRP